jgi:hypothetical protein
VSHVVEVQTPQVTVEVLETETVVEQVTQLTEVEISNQRGPQGVPASADLVSLRWGTPAAESGDAIEIGAAVEDYAGAAVNSSLVDVEIRVTDSAASCEPSATATLGPAAVPVGTILAGSGTATLVMRTTAGALRLRVTEAAAGYRYLWVKGAGNARLWVRSATGVQELIFS